MAIDSLDALDWLRKHLEHDEPDLVRDMVASFAERLMSPRPMPCVAPVTGAQCRQSELAQRLKLVVVIHHFPGLGPVGRTATTPERTTEAVLVGCSTVPPSACPW